MSSDGPGVTRAYQAGERATTTGKARRARPATVQDASGDPKYLGTNPKCSRRVLFTVKFANSPQLD